jgi:hypothetical protein
MMLIMLLWEQLLVILLFPQERFVSNKLVDRAAVEALWVKGLYQYQLENIKKALPGVDDADFPEFAELVGRHLIPITSQDPNQINMLAGYNAEIIISFAKLAKDHRNLLASFMEKLCKDMDEDDKAESAKILSGMVSGFIDLSVAEAMLEKIPVGMSGFEKKTLLKSLSKMSPDSFFAFCQIINRVTPVFYTPEHTKDLYLRLASIAEKRQAGSSETNASAFREVASIPLDVFKAVDTHLGDSNRMINFIVDLIGKEPNQRQEFIAANIRQ